MLIVMKSTATQEQIQHIVDLIEGMGLEARPMPGAGRTAVCVLQNQGSVSDDIFIDRPGVAEVIRVTKPYKLVSREAQTDDTVIHLNGETIGKGLTMIAGPCSVEKEPITLKIAESLRELGVKTFRAGAFKPRTGPYAFQGMGEEGLEILAKVKRELDMNIVTEVMDTELIPQIREVADVFQVGTRNMQNYALLKKLGKEKKPVLLKRGMSATLEELLQAAEYIMAGGNHDVILCERGIRTFSEHSRNTLDVAAVPSLKELTHLPIIIDPSHAAGRRSLVAPLARAGVAAGADGIIMEAHVTPDKSLSDAKQAYPMEKMAELIKNLQAIHEISSS